MNVSGRYEVADLNFESAVENELTVTSSDQLCNLYVIYAGKNFKFTKLLARVLRGCSCVILRLS